MAKRNTGSASRSLLGGLRSWLKARAQMHAQLYLLGQKLRHPRDHEKIAYAIRVRRGMTVVDAGANVGNFTLLFARLVGPAGRIHAFEPVPSSFAVLSERTQQAGLKNVASRNCALGEEDGTCELLQPEIDPAQASLNRQTGGNWPAATRILKHPCEMVRLDTVSQREKWASVDFLKIDAEGAELSILRGASGILENFGPIVSVELNRDCQSAFDYGPEDLGEFLVSRGYTHFELVTHEGSICLEDAVDQLRNQRHYSPILIAAKSQEKEFGCLSYIFPTRKKKNGPEN